MRVEFIAVWSVMWRMVWLPLAEYDVATPDLFCELYREVIKGLKWLHSVEELADIIDDPSGTWKPSKP
jgi:hypothetical protein